MVVSAAKAGCTPRAVAITPAGGRDTVNVVKGPEIKQRITPIIHLVKQGDSLFSIANRYGVDIRSLKKFNKIKLAEICVGQQLHLK